MVSIEQVKELRDMTGISIMQCKKALEEVDGDKEKALVILRKKSSEVAAKKADRELAAGTLGAYVHTNGTVGAIVVLSCETDFVAKNPDFVLLARDIAMQVTAMNPQFLRMEDVDDSAKDAARDVFARELADKPADMQEKIMEGKLASYFKDQVLLEQAFVKNPEVTIGAMLSEATQKFGERIAVSEFRRFAV